MPFLLELLRQYSLDLGIKAPLVFSSDMHASGHKSGLVLEVFKSLGATTYLSGLHGQNYIDDKAFNDKYITVKFQDYKHPACPQAWPGFETSIFDLLFNQGMDSLLTIIAN